MVEPVIVPANEEQKKNFIDVAYGEKDFRKKFLQRLVAKQQEYTEKHKPFAYSLARLDFEDEIRKAELEIQRSGRKLTEEYLLKIDIGDIEKYGDPHLFEFLGEKPIDEMVIINGTKVPQRAYMRREYRTKRGFHNLTVDMPWYAYEEELKQKGKK